MVPMQTRSTGGIELQVSKRSDSGGSAFTPTLDVKEFLYFLLLIPAGVTALLPLGIYSPLDIRLPMGSIICAFLLAAVLQLTNIVQRQPGNDVARWRKVYICSALALPLIGILVFLNGSLDRSPRSEVRATVIAKIAPIGYREAQSTLKVSSWRPGRSFEDLNVSTRVFQRAAVGRSITVEMHEGYFRLPWYGKISPE
jgi:hypothetical protein